jgi:hypothetical protein
VNPSGYFMTSYVTVTFYILAALTYLDLYVWYGSLNKHQ